MGTGAAPRKIPPPPPPHSRPFPLPLSAPAAGNHTRDHTQRCPTAHQLQTTHPAPPPPWRAAPWRRCNVTVERKRRLYCCGAKLNVVGRGSRRGGKSHPCVVINGDREGAAQWHTPPQTSSVARTADVVSSSDHSSTPSAQQAARDAATCRPRPGTKLTTLPAATIGRDREGAAHTPFPLRPPGTPHHHTRAA